MYIKFPDNSFLEIHVYDFEIKLRRRDIFENVKFRWGGKVES